MPEEKPDDSSAQGSALFETAREAAEAKDFDKAIDLYIQALRQDPNAVDQGHIRLRDLALKRQLQGGKKPTQAEIDQHLSGQTHLDRMLGAEYLLAKNPGHFSYAEAILKAAVEGGYKKAGKWIADLMFLANNGARKPSLKIYVILKDAYEAIGEFKRAHAACKRAQRIRPASKTLAREIKRLTSKLDEIPIQDEVEEEETFADLEETERLDETESLEDLDEVDDTAQLAPAGVQPEAPTVDPAIARARDAFTRAREVAGRENYDYAIELYLRGLQTLPDELEQAHLPLCEVALQRKEKGGKKPSMMEKVKLIRGKTPLEQMINAESLFAKDPDHVPYAEAMLKAAVAGEFNKTAGWIANYIFQQNNAAEKPSFKTYILLKESYAALSQYDKAVAACQRCVQLRPKDETLADELKNLTAEMTVARGKYDQEGDFRKAIKDRAVQEKLHAQEGVVKTIDYRLVAVEDARKAVAAEPELPRNIYNLANTLADLETDEAENEAIQVLQNAYANKKDFGYKQEAGQIHIRQLKRKIRQAKQTLESKPNDTQTQQRLTGFSAKLNEVELEHYRLCIENYPTDLAAKYEYGVRLLRNKRYDDAIPFFQESQRDPRNRIAAMGKIGYCFFMKGWHNDAIDVFTQAIDACEVKDDAVAKELRYNLGRAYEEQGQSQKALEIYRRIAQLDFSYKDVRKRVDELRAHTDQE
jgi:tetratricopeptide (TPR) repeat protein